MPNESLSRRTLLDAAVRVAALPAGMAFFSQWSSASGQHTHNAPPGVAPMQSYQPKFFAPGDFEVLQAFTEILIPTDDTPGAREAYCAQFIDFLLHSMDGYSPEVQGQWRAAMVSLQAAGFHSASKAQRAVLVRAMSQPEHDSSAHHPAFSAYRLIKRETVFAFYTSRTGSIEALDYRGNTYNIQFPACTHPEHQRI